MVQVTDNNGKKISFKRNVLAPLQNPASSKADHEKAKIYLLSFVESLKRHIGYTQGFNTKHIEEAFTYLKQPRLSGTSSTIFTTINQEDPDAALKSLQTLSQRYIRHQAMQSILWISAGLGLMGCAITGIVYLKHKNKVNKKIASIVKSIKN